MIAEVVLNIKVDRAFHYRVPPHLGDRLSPGMRVTIPFRNAVKTGFCVGFAEKAEVPYLKEIRGILDEVPLAGPSILRLTRWIADRYLCSWGTALQAAIPPGARRSSAARTVRYVELVQDGRVSGRSERQARILEHLRESRAPVQWKVLAARTGATRSNVEQLIRKGFVRWKHVRRRPDLFSEVPAEPRKKFELNEDQERSLAALRTRLDAGKTSTALLYGVTGSGKTEVYLRAMEHAARLGRSSILLVPEVALTPQSVARVRARFDRVAVLHSTLTEADRAEAWQSVRRGEVDVVVGARSAVFAPLPNLGLIVLDEEHEGTYKQESDPRYHAREVAGARARFENAVVILGTATPSLETWREAEEGRIERLELPRRVQALPMPDIRLVDMQNEVSPTRPIPVVSRVLEEAIRAAVGRGEQAILFLNRRGYATYARCTACGWVARCDRCDSSLNYHRDTRRWQCHYCLADRALPAGCPRCSGPELKNFGIGTQKVEDEAGRLFADFRIGRMDSDAMKTRDDYRESLQGLWRGDTDILIGTQMIAKGLDVPGVTVVGVISADTAFHVPDFRAAERTFQLVTQVAGRAGRSPKGGTVFVQTLHPRHAAIVAAAAYNYRGFAERELKHREESGYPPYSTLIRFILEGRDPADVMAASREAGERLRSMFDEDDIELLGPSEAPLGKIRNRHRRHLLMKVVRPDHVLSALKKLDWSPPSKVSLTVDVDPQSLL